MVPSNSPFRKRAFRLDETHTFEKLPPLSHERPPFLENKRLASTRRLLLTGPFWWTKASNVEKHKSFDNLGINLGYREREARFVVDVWVKLKTHKTNCKQRGTRNGHTKHYDNYDLGTIVLEKQKNLRKVVFGSSPRGSLGGPLGVHRGPWGSFGGPVGGPRRPHRQITMKAIRFYLAFGRSLEDPLGAPWGPFGAPGGALEVGGSRGRPKEAP